MHARTHTHTLSLSQTHTQTRAHTHTNICTHTHKHAHTHTHTHLYTFERGPSLFFRNQFFYPLPRTHTPENIYGNRGLDRYTRTCIHVIWYYPTVDLPTPTIHPKYITPF